MSLTSSSPRVPPSTKVTWTPPGCAATVGWSASRRIACTPRPSSLRSDCRRRRRRSRSAPRGREWASPLGDRLTPAPGPVGRPPARAMSRCRPSSTWTAQPRHGSNECTVRRISSGRCRIGDRGLQQRGLVGAALPFRIARPRVPGRRHDALVVADHLVLDLDPVTEGAARRFHEAPAARRFRPASTDPTSRRCAPAACRSACSAASCSIHSSSRLATSWVSSARAATRPSVEKSAVGGAFSFASVPSTSDFTSGAPDA